MNIQQFPGNYNLFMLSAFIIFQFQESESKALIQLINGTHFRHVSTFSDGQRQTTGKKNSENYQ